MVAISRRIVRLILASHAPGEVATSRFLLGALLLNNRDVASVIRRELRKVVGTETHVTVQDITQVLQAEVIKRDVLEGPDAEEAAKRVKRVQRKPTKSEQKQGELAKDDESNQEDGALSTTNQADPPKQSESGELSDLAT